ncbi:MAG: type V CRISPR-associated protein Cas12b [Akkermansia sp.]|nr:type V CRISPR-associated protein Cas12b [Akkermansia sp.]
MATRIYQGRVTEAEFEDTKLRTQQGSAAESLAYTFSLFQDAVNYHLTALAGMIEPTIDPACTLGRFRSQVKAIWSRPPRDNAKAQTLQQSLCKTLNLPTLSSFEDAIDEIFRNTARRELLPYVLQLIIERTGSGDGAIQQEGRSLLPKLCSVTFKGNYDYSAKGNKAEIGKRRLQRELSRQDITQNELEALAAEMDLSWAGIKTQPNADFTDADKFTAAESQEKVKEAMEKLCQALKQNDDPVWMKLAEEKDINLYTEVVQVLQTKPLIIGEHHLAKNNKANALLKQAAIFFMYYPCELSAWMLARKLGKEKKAKESTSPYDCSALENDPILLCRGKRGFVYRGFSALPEWETGDNKMYSAEWDVLAFKEALKTLHSFELKTEERNQHVEELEKELQYMLSGKGKSALQGEDEESPLPVLGDDPRFILLEQLVKEIAPDTYEEYTISSRALRGYEEIRENWQKAKKAGQCSEAELRDIVRKAQSKAERFGSGVLFEALCEKKYQPIWNDWVDEANPTLPRSQNILRDYLRFQELKQEIEQYKESVNITAAEPTVSPRQLLFSDLNNFGPKSKGHEFIKGEPGKVRLRSVVRNNKGHLIATNVIVKFAAPRFERDELGTDSAYWPDEKKSNTELASWLQPMMKALHLDPAQLHMKKAPAVGLQVKYHTENRDSQATPTCLLNFPVSFDFEPIHQQLGKAAIWNAQLLGTTDEKLHLHWPSTYTAKVQPWWENTAVQENGFQVLGIDLGMRTSAAWSLTTILPTPESTTPKGTRIEGRYVGSDGAREWYGFCTANGLIRIDGEGKSNHHAPDTIQAPPGIGRPTPEDEKLALYLLELAGFTNKRPCNILELCDRALKAFGRLISRCRRMQSLLVKLKDERQQQEAIKRALEENPRYKEQWQNNTELMNSLRNHDVRRACDILLTELIKLRDSLPHAAEKLTNLLLPRKHGEWSWQAETRPGYIGAGRMLMGQNETPRRHIFHRGGLSIPRLTQIEDLRRLLQSMNRILHETPGIRADFGSSLRDVRVIDPCPDILRKIENIREQRVNKIAHEITAKALGLQLLAPRKDKNVHHRDVIHGEYEAIPNRRPVDFVILENLSRYRTSIDRSPRENSSLMRWAHRQIVAKVKQLLEEVFGIPVLCTHAAYTSKFDALTSEPGFRAVEMTDWRLKKMYESSLNDTRTLGELYDKLLTQVKERRDDVKLLMPGETNNGEYFICHTDNGVRVRHADINAAINIAWRGIAAPEALHLLHRVRLASKKGKLSPVYSNKREKALEKKWEFTQNKEIATDNGLASCFWTQASSPLEAEARYSAPGAQTPVLLTHGKTLWGYIKSQRWNLCHQYNIRVLQKIGIDTSAQERHLNKHPLLQEDDSDIPL